MQFRLTQDQEQIQQSCDDYLGGAYGWSQHRARLAVDMPLDGTRWRQIAELGWLGLGVPEHLGGLGLGPVEMMILMEACGKALLFEPIIPTAVLGAPLLARGLATNEMKDVLGAVVSGDATLAVACAERASALPCLEVSTIATATSEGRWSIAGKKSLVDHGGEADWIVVPASVAGGEEGPEHLALFVVPGHTAGLRRDSARLLDGSRVADIVLDNVSVPDTHVLRFDTPTDRVLNHTLELGLAARCAEAVGAMSRAIDITRAYLLERKQFGVALSEFQVLRHKLVDMVIALERARSMSLLAARRLASDVSDADGLRRDLGLAKLVVGRAARFVGEGAIQLHGGMGMTDEYPIGHYYRKLLTCDFAFGSADEHLRDLVRGERTFAAASVAAPSWS